MKALKIAIVSFLLSTLLIGCVNENNCKAYQSNQTSSFNQETYVWESFQFPTNRTSGVQ